MGLVQFDRQQYLNLETFRRNGIGVRTPVWFVRDGESLFVNTEARSGKVKRIRNNPRVNIAPCKVDGKVLGDWVPAIVTEVTDPVIGRKVDRLLGKKYGLLKVFFALTSSLNRTKSTILEIKGIGE